MYAYTFAYEHSNLRK